MVGGQGLGRGHGLGGVKVVVKVGGQGRGVKVRGMIGGHKDGVSVGVKVGGSLSGGQCLGEGSWSGGRGSRSGELGLDGRFGLLWGEVVDK